MFFILSKPPFKLLKIIKIHKKSGNMKRLEQKKIITLVLSLTVILSIIYVNFDKSTSIKVLKVFKSDS